MRRTAYNLQEDQLKTRYRMLLREADKHPQQATHYYSEADKVLHQITLLRTHQRNGMQKQF